MIETIQWTPELGDGSPTLGIVYGFRVTATGEYRYVGQTTKSISRRTGQHLTVAKGGRKTPFYDWLRKTPREDYEVVVLERVVTSREDLGLAEIGWITLYRELGDRLLNLTDGGLGPTGIEWSPERREVARERNRGRVGISMPGESNPMWGRKHSEAQKAQWSVERQGMNAGASNPNYGKFGAEHPGFGHKMSDESRRRLSEMRMGERNPNFGKAASDETRAKMSAARKGRPMPSSVRSAHTRHHTNKGVQKPECRFCVEDAAKNTASDSE